ncbi:MAG: DUF3035 domain-containing protein [Alphaproteobacteria bacterium]|nr:DUF3035 domain-containing protein [Alphaproteobacteria bacterium]
MRSSDMKYGRRYGLVILLPIIGLAGCGQLADTFGYGKNPPDEFAIIRKSPLIIPPDYQLKPPLTTMEGLQPLPEQNKVRTLLTNAPPPPADTELSEGERKLLMLAGASNSSDSIRAQIDRDGQTVVPKKDNFVERLLGFGKDDVEAFELDRLERETESESMNESETEGEVKSKAETKTQAEDKARSRSRARAKR